MTFPRKILPLLAAAWLPAVALGAPDAPLDLGQGLAYLRVHSVAADAKVLDDLVAADAALVIDLRFATTQAGDAAILGGALARHRASGLLCVLVSPFTPPELTAPLTGAEGKLVTLGVADSLPAARVVVEQTKAADRLAYDAFETGTPLATLLSGKIAKERYDEAALMNEFSNGNTAAEPPPGPDPASLKSTPAKPPPLVDRVLQRAVDLHAALAAIKPRS